MRVKVSIIGHFGGDKNFLDGQTVKTKIITEELQNHLGQDQVLKFDTHGRWKTLLKAPFQVFRALKDSDNILIFPAHNGLRIYAPLLSFQRSFFKSRKIHYVVIGGWLPEFLSGRKCLVKSLKKFDGIYVETNTMKNALEAQGFTNVFVMPNCKKLKILSEDELVYPSSAPYKLCTFSRVMKEKGIEDAVNAVKIINEEYGCTICTLDIYGAVDSHQTDWFEKLILNFSDEIQYCGAVPPDKSVDIIKNYYALLFPTCYWTEGIPGTVIDAYAAGIPVIASRWKSFGDVVDDGITGIGYSFMDMKEFQNILKKAVECPQLLNDMKLNCVKKASLFSVNVALKELLNNLEG